MVWMWAVRVQHVFDLRCSFLLTDFGRAGDIVVAVYVDASMNVDTEVETRLPKRPYGKWIESNQAVPLLD